MKPENTSRRFLKITQSWAKMFEYSVPPEDRIEVSINPAQLFELTIGILGDAAARTSRTDNAFEDDESKNLQFSARFFNAYLEGRFREDDDAYLLLLASAAFYLSHVPGSSIVLARRLAVGTPDIDGGGLEGLLHWLLLGARESLPAEVNSPFSKELQETALTLAGYYRGEVAPEVCMSAASALRARAYANGSPRQLLLADICAAVLRVKIRNSAQRCLPLYSKLALSDWKESLGKKGFLRELWPSQHLLGEKGIFSGVSAIVQMPTSAGKTHATELVIRSAFLAGRTSLAVVVAPFRALCREISDAVREAFRGENVSVDELTDVLQPDFDFERFLSEDFSLVESRRILVVTPEKLLYVLRHESTLADSIGLVIYDEGHQFDSGTRGVTYELLLTSLRRRIPKDAQTLLISAVISNAEAIGAWLLGENPTIATSASLSPMQRRVAFAGWSRALGQLHFMEEEALESEDFFVPRLISQQRLSRRGRETKERLFPDKDSSNAIALYLGIKLVSQGSVAIFCGRKDSVAGICAEISEAYDRDLTLPKPLEASDQEEVAKLTALYGANLGIDSPGSRAASLGVLSHNGNTPHGIRLAVEYAMKVGAAKFVVCTSTLAQGVNLPIRYLIVTSVYQAGERIKVRDFHNLIGRAGRAGMHIEGTILFAEPSIYDDRGTARNSWRWSQAHELLNPKNAEPIVSSIQGLFEPFKSDDGKYEIELSLVDLARLYAEDETGLQGALETFARGHLSSGFTAKGLAEQSQRRFKIFAAIESYLMANWEESEGGDFSRELAEGTLAYALVSDDQKRQLVELFSILTERIRASVPDATRRAVFAQTLQGVKANLALETWAAENVDALTQTEAQEDLLRILWPVVAEGIENSTFRRIDTPETMLEAAQSWISGTSFGTILEELAIGGVRLLWGERRRNLTVEHVVEICEGAFGYDAALRIGAIADLLAAQSSADDERQALIHRLGELHKRLKYGLPRSSAVAFYECGFSDRVVAQHLANIVGRLPITRSGAIERLRESQLAAWTSLAAYPKYFQTRLEGLVA
jgi:POLQ-like helicase